MAEDSFDEGLIGFFYRNHSYCDWRVTMSCEDGRIFETLYTLNLVIITLIAIVCIILLWYRISRQGCTLLSPKIPGTGFIRPNPVEGFLVWAILWLIGRILFILILWSGRFENNYLALDSGAWFVVGTYLQIGSHLNSKQKPWRPNNKLSDGFLIMMTILTPLTIWPITIMSGYFRANKNLKVAEILISTRYLLWGLWCGVGAIGTIYFGKELLNVLSYHISLAKQSNHITIRRVERMQSGLEKIKFTLCIILSTYIYYLIYCPITSVFRVWIITHSKPLNIFMFVTYAFFNPLCIIFVVSTITIRIIQGYKRESPTKTITKKIGENNNTTTTNNNSLHIKQLNDTSTHLAANNSLHRNRVAQEIPELDSITSAIANMDQYQFDDLVAYTQYNTNNNISDHVNSVDLNNNVKMQIVEEIEKIDSGSGFNELNEEKNHCILIIQPERVVVRPASPTIPIFPINQ
ncbi:hypothetical protein C1645_755409 [Glomus cerebriforme]|uniref:Uncharacterized protein n=1 Tax=Glomus cerebriforme TaxID=658196 RepID=A0A397TD84_9GLOM|nr:hypothetical protein C1645_755409 [Glomus cerebriforme]